MGSWVPITNTMSVSQSQTRQIREDVISQMQQDAETIRTLRCQVELEKGVSARNRGLYRGKIEELKQQLSTANQQLSTAKAEPEEIAGLNQQLSTTNQQLSTANQQLSTAGEEIAGLNQKLFTAGEEIAGLNQQLFTTNQQLSTANQQLSTAGEEIAGLNQQLSTAKTETAQRWKMLRQTQMQLHQEAEGPKEANRARQSVVAGLKELREMVTDGWSLPQQKQYDDWVTVCEKSLK